MILKVLMVVVVVVVLICEQLDAVHVGLYVDNGRNQTMIERTLSTDEKADLQEDLLNMLGLPSKPKISNAVKRSASEYLMDIYSLMDDGDDANYRRSKRSANLNLNWHKHKTISDSDIIMSFESLDGHDDLLRHEKGQRLLFNVSEIPNSAEIILAELRLFARNPTPDKVFTIDLYHVLGIDKKSGKYERLSSANISQGFSGWLSLNITACLPSWVAFPCSNKGLYLSVRQGGETGDEVSPDVVGLKSKKRKDGIDPFIVVYIKANNRIAMPRRIGRSHSRRHSRFRKSNYDSLMRYHSHHNTSDICKLKTLYISFKELEWNDWILAPEGYSAYYCSGQCNFPLNAHMNATNHAIIQTLVHLMNPLRYPKPCCAPTKLGPVSVLYYLDDSSVQIKKYKKMAVRTCGCH